MGDAARVDDGNPVVYSPKRQRPPAATLRQDAAATSYPQPGFIVEDRRLRGTPVPLNLINVDPRKKMPARAATNAARPRFFAPCRSASPAGNLAIGRGTVYPEMIRGQPCRNSTSPTVTES